MTLDSVTSLADLEFRVKTNKYYKQMAIKTAKRCYGGYSAEMNKKLKIYEEALAFLHKISIQHNPDSCASIVAELNCIRDKIVEEVEPTPVVEAAPVVEVAIPAPHVVSVAKIKEILKKKSSNQEDCQENYSWSDTNTTFRNESLINFTFNETLKQLRNEAQQRLRRPCDMWFPITNYYVDYVHTIEPDR